MRLVVCRPRCAEFFSFSEPAVAEKSLKCVVRLQNPGSNAPNAGGRTGGSSKGRRKGFETGSPSGRQQRRPRAREARGWGRLGRGPPWGAPGRADAAFLPAVNLEELRGLSRAVSNPSRRGAFTTFEFNQAERGPPAHWTLFPCLPLTHRAPRFLKTVKLVFLPLQVSFRLHERVGKERRGRPGRMHMVEAVTFQVIKCTRIVKTGLTLLFCNLLSPVCVCFLSMKCARRYARVRGTRDT